MYVFHDCSNIQIFDRKFLNKCMNYQSFFTKLLSEKNSFDVPFTAVQCVWTDDSKVGGDSRPPFLKFVNKTASTFMIYIMPK